MKKKFCGILSAVLLCLILSCLFFAGCSVEAQEEADSSGGYYFYYIDKDETRLCKEIYYPEQETTDYLMQYLVTRLNDKSLEVEGQSLLPKEVQINSFDIGDKVLTLKFNRKYNSMSGTREILVRAGVVKIFLQVPEITSVKFMVGEKELTNMKGEPVGNMTASTFAEFTGNDRDSYHYDTFTLYFTDKTGTKLIPETRNLYYRRNLPRERVILEQLAKGPMVKGHYPTMPEGTEILSVTTADRVCYADFNQVFVNSELNVSDDVAIYSVVNSLLASADADRVQMSVQGNPEAAFKDEVSLYNFYEWNENIISSEEASGETE